MNSLRVIKIFEIFIMAFVSSCKHADTTGGAPGYHMHSQKGSHDQSH